MPRKLDHERILALRATGLSYFKIAKEVGCHPSAAHQVVKWHTDPEWRARRTEAGRRSSDAYYHRKNPGARRNKPRPPAAPFRHIPGDPYDVRTVPLPISLDTSPGPSHQPAGGGCGPGQAETDAGQVPGPTGDFVPG